MKFNDWLDANEYNFDITRSRFKFPENNYVSEPGYLACVCPACDDSLFEQCYVDSIDTAQKEMVNHLLKNRDTCYFNIPEDLEP